MWVLENGRLSSASYNWASGRSTVALQIITELPDNVQVVVDERNDLREGRAARPATPEGP